MKSIGNKYLSTTITRRSTKFTQIDTFIVIFKDQRRIIYANFYDRAKMVKQEAKSSLVKTVYCISISSTNLLKHNFIIIVSVFSFKMDYSLNSG